MSKEIIIFTLLSMLAKIIAFARELLLAYCYGTSMTSDVYLISMTLPVTLFGFVSTGILSGYIPIYTRIRQQEGKKIALYFTNQVLNFLLLICLVLIVLYYAFSEQFINLFASGFTNEMVDMTIKFTDISVMAIPWSCITTVLTAYLQTNSRLQVTALVSVPLNLGIALSIVFAFFNGNLYFLPVGYILASAAQAIYVLYFSYKEKFHYQWICDMKDQNVKFFLKNIVLLSISSSIQQINLLIDRTLATRISVGGLSVFEYGSKVNDFVMGLSIIPISAAIFPEMARCAKNYLKLKEKVREAWMTFLIIMLPLTALVLMYAEPMVKIIYYRGAFDDKSLSMTKQVVFFYGIGLIAFAFREFFSKIFYAIEDTKTPMRNALIGVILNIILNFVLSEMLGIGGLALATSISAWVTVFFLYISLKRKIGTINLKEILKKLGNIILVTLVSSIVSFVLYKNVISLLKNELISLGISGCVFLIIYILGISRMYKFTLKNLITIIMHKKLGE